MSDYQHAYHFHSLCKNPYHHFQRLEPLYPSGIFYQTHEGMLQVLDNNVVL